MKTRVTEILGIKYPIMQGGMQGANCAESAAAVSNAGGLGTICAALYTDLDEYRAEIRKLRSLTAHPFAVNVSMVPEHTSTELTWSYFRIAAEEGVPVVETAGRNPKEYVPFLKDHGIKIVHKCTAVRYALSAQRAGVDIVSILGYESAGHPGMDDVSLSVLVPKVAQTLSIPVMAAGGSADGRGLVAALAWGAEGIVMGSRFLATHECPVHPAIKAHIVQCTELDTVLIQRSIKNAIRVVKNEHADEVLAQEAHGATLQELLPLISGKLSRGYMAEGRIDRGLLSAGQSIGLIDEVKSTRDVIEDTMKQARQIISSLSRL